MSASIVQIVSEHGVAGVIALIGILFFSIGCFISVFALIYASFSKNWGVWKYIGYLLLIGVGLLVLSLFISFVAGILRG
ncbi:hypothetical protein M0P48_04465 [Candidatus Gracilibacteria bacterium]|jgi:hypothetical protein|nr:hypothetical protein [Candidatus Gracilibacteria bacterium]